MFELSGWFGIVSDRLWAGRLLHCHVGDDALQPGETRLVQHTPSICWNVHFLFLILFCVLRAIVIIIATIIMIIIVIMRVIILCCYYF